NHLTPQCTQSVPIERGIAKVNVDLLIILVPRDGIEPPTRGFSGENHSRNALVTIRNSLFSKETDRKQTQSNVTGFPGL
ncbi:hypothetical protein, partial [Thiomonas sp.]